MKTLDGLRPQLLTLEPYCQCVAAEHDESAALLGAGGYVVRCDK
jgi:hypothetical protein